MGLSTEAYPATRSASWMVIQTGGLSFAVESDRIDVVFRTQEAAVTQLSKPKVRIEVQQGRPWCIVPLDSLALLQEFSDEDPEADLQWTIGLRHPSGLAWHVASVEGPFKGVVSNQMLKTPHGDWPLLEWRS